MDRQGCLRDTVARTIAVVDRSIRSYPGKIQIKNLPDLKNFLAKWGERPFFGKLLRSMSAYGAFLCDFYDNTHVYLRGRQPIAIEDFFNYFIGANAYVFQPVVENRSFFDNLTKNLATIRLVVLAFDNQINLAFSVPKVPSGGNIIDSALRIGNYVCEVSGGDGGRITSIVSTGPLTALRSEIFPPTGAQIIGKQVPYWAEAVKLAAKAATVFFPVRLQSIDVA
jgi:hypothetical protein